MNIDKLLKLANESEKTTIGTQKEKMLHRFIKYMLSDDPTHHEIKVGSYFVDVMINDHIYEIQTQAFNVLKIKLEQLLKDYQVTVVFPLCAKKKFTYITDEKNNSMPRSTTRNVSPLSFFQEAYRIKHLLKNPNLSFKIIALEVTVYKKKELYNRNKIHSIIPTNIIQIIELPQDYYKLIPVLPSQFTSADVQKASSLNKRQLHTAMNVLHELGYFKRIGKLNRFYLYELNKEITL